MEPQVGPTFFRVGNMFEDSQPILDSQPQLSDSDTGASPPHKKQCAGLDRKFSFLETAKSILIQNLSDSECEDEPWEVEIEPKDPITACKEPFLDHVQRDRAFRMAEIFSGSGILAEEMSTLGFVTMSVDYITGGATHDISNKETVTQHMLGVIFILYDKF